MPTTLGDSGRPFMFHVLGIDAGGTKTVCLLADDQGQVVAEARRGGANLQAVGELEVEKVLHEVMEEAIGNRAIVPAAICLGIAGVDRPDDSAVVDGIMRRIGYKARVRRRQRRAGRARGRRARTAGVVVISGTGSISYGRNARGRGRAIRRLGIRARRRGQRLLDRPRGAAGGPA